MKTPDKTLPRQLTDIDLKLLRIFKTAVESGGFSGAEVALNVAASTMSNYMSDLEKRLGMSLCTRGRAGFSVTPQGMIVYQAILDLFASIESFQGQVNEARGEFLGDLHVVVEEHAIFIPNNGIADGLRAFCAEAPKIRLSLSNSLGEEIPDAVTRGPASLGIAVVHSPTPNLSSEPLFSEDMALYCGRGHPLFGCAPTEQALETLNKCQFLETSIMHSNHRLGPVVKRWQSHASALQHEIRVVLILTGIYIGYLPRHIAEQPGWVDDLHCLFPKRFGYRNVYQLLMKPQSATNIVTALMRDSLLKYCKTP